MVETLVTQKTKQILEEIEAYLKDTEYVGIKTKVKQVTLPTELYLKGLKYMDDQNISFSSLVEEALAEYFINHE